MFVVLNNKKLGVSSDACNGSADDGRLIERLHFVSVCCLQLVIFRHLCDCTAVRSNAWLSQLHAACHPRARSSRPTLVKTVIAALDPRKES